MHIFMDNFHQGGKYSSQTASHQTELNREENLLMKNYWTSPPYRPIILIWVAAQVLVEIVRDQTVFRKSVLIVEVLFILHEKNS